MMYVVMNDGVNEWVEAVDEKATSVPAASAEGNFDPTDVEFEDQWAA